MNEELSTCVSNLAYEPVGSWLLFYPRYPSHVRKLRQLSTRRPVMFGYPTRRMSIGQCLLTPKLTKSLHGTPHPPRTRRFYTQTAPSRRNTTVAVVFPPRWPRAFQTGTTKIFVSCAPPAGCIPCAMVFLKTRGSCRV